VDNPGKKLMNPYLKSKPGVVVHICNTSYTGDRGKWIMFQDQPPNRSMRPYLKNNLKKQMQKGLGMWFKYCSICKHEALNSIPVLTKINK
jgi:hypothetical protein